MAGPGEGPRAPAVASAVPCAVPAEPGSDKGHGKGTWQRRTAACPPAASAGTTRWVAVERFIPPGYIRAPLPGTCPGWGHGATKSRCPGVSRSRLPAGSPRAVSRAAPCQLHLSAGCRRASEGCLGPRCSRHAIPRAPAAAAASAKNNRDCREWLLGHHPPASREPLGNGDGALREPGDGELQAPGMGHSGTPGMGHSETPGMGHSGSRGWGAPGLGHSGSPGMGHLGSLGM